MLNISNILLFSQLIAQYVGVFAVMAESEDVYSEVGGQELK